MHILPVQDPLSQKEFLEFPVRLYASDPNWIRPLDKDIEGIFHEKENKFFRHGRCQRWILKDAQQKTIGRVAAFVNDKTAKSVGNYACGGMGFFECIDQKEAAFILFDTCQDWLLSQGMQAMEGPINFGERDKWWGLLIDGFTPPNYSMPYHFAYYQKFFEAYGFQDYFRQFTYGMEVRAELPEKYKEKAVRIARDPKYHFKCFEAKKLDQFAEDFVTIYNKAWVKHAGVGSMVKGQAQALFKKMLPVIDPDIVIFCYYENQPIGFFIMLPELNQLFKFVDGKLDLWGKIKFAYYRWRGACRKMFGVIFGIIPEFQGRGVEGAIILESARIVQPAHKYDDFEMNWIGDFNPKMMHLAESLGARIVKTHITYRKLFDPNIAFERARIID